MTTLFFILLILPLLSEMEGIRNPEGRRDLREKLNRFNKEQKDETIPFDSKITLNGLGISGKLGLQVFYILLCVLGMLLSAQWILFLILFVLGFITTIIKKLSDNNTYQDLVTRFDALISLVLLLYIIINHFHHLDIIPLL